MYYILLRRKERQIYDCSKKNILKMNNNKTRFENIFSFRFLAYKLCRLKFIIILIKVHYSHYLLC